MNSAPVVLSRPSREFNRNATFFQSCSARKPYNRGHADWDCNWQISNCKFEICNLKSVIPNAARARQVSLTA